MNFFKRRPSRTDLQQRGIYKESGNDGMPSVKDRLSSLLNKRPSQSELENRGIYKGLKYIVYREIYKGLIYKRHT